MKLELRVFIKICLIRSLHGVNKQFYFLFHAVSPSAAKNVNEYCPQPYPEILTQLN